MSFRPCTMNLCKENGAKYVEPTIVRWRGNIARTFSITPQTVPRPRKPTVYSFPGDNPYSLGGCSVNGGFVIATLTFNQSRANDWYPNYHGCHEALLEMTFDDGSKEDLLISFGCTFEATGHVSMALHAVARKADELLAFLGLRRSHARPERPKTNVPISLDPESTNGARTTKREASAKIPREMGPPPAP
jgi:hypothetical protein